MATLDIDHKQHFALLDGHQYMNLTTYRKNGTEVSRPVWFAEIDDHLYVLSKPTTGKVKQINRNGEVFVSPSDARGNPLSEKRQSGIAAVYEKGHPIAEKANKALIQKYGLFVRAFLLMYAIRRIQEVYIEVQLR